MKILNGKRWKKSHLNVIDMGDEKKVFKATFEAHLRLSYFTFQGVNGLKKRFC
jgi:hypothetical protein